MKDNVINWLFLKASSDAFLRENIIAVSRRDYNLAVEDHNNRKETFLTNIIAGMFGFKEYSLFKAIEGSNEVPTVQF